MTPFDLVVSRLQQRGTPPVKRGTGWMAICPGHEDRTPSLSINETENGSVLVNCFSGCNPRDLLASLELTLADLFAADPQKVGSKKQKEYIYYDEHGERLYRVVKYLEADGHKTFRQQAATPDGWAYSMGQTRRVLYYLPRVLAAIGAGRPIWIVEGEKDVENLSFGSGAVATCNPGGAETGTGSKFTDNMIASLAGATTINICIDNDLPGERHGRYLATRLTSPACHVRVFSSPTGKDISDHLEAFGSVETLDILWDSDHPNEWLEGNVEATEPVIEIGDWQLQPLSTLTDGNIEPVIPSILERTDGEALFYEGKINSIYGASNSGKTWLVIEALAQQIKQGHHIAYIDFEDRHTTLHERLTDLGVTQDQIHLAHYVHPQMASSPQQIEDVLQYCSQIEVTVIGIDSAGEGLALANADPNSDDAVATWYREIPRRLADAGACVILVDHSPKNTEHSKGHAIGSQRKKAAIDGASYEIKTKEPFSKGRQGLVSLTCSKDRHGNYATGLEIAQAIMHIGNPDGPSILLYDPTDITGKNIEGKPVDEALCQRIIQWLDQCSEPVSKNTIKNGQKEFLGTTAPTRAAVNLMICDGRIVKEGTLYRSRKPADEAGTSSAPRQQPSEPHLVTSSDLVTRSSPTSSAPRQEQEASETATSSGSSHTYMNLGVTKADEMGVEPTEDPYGDTALFEEIDSHYDKRTGL